MKNVLVVGALGKMGSLVCSLLEKEGANVFRADKNDNLERILQNKKTIDAAINFSNYIDLNQIKFCTSNKIPLLLGGTNITNDAKKYLEKNKNIIPIGISSNFSLGINILMEFVKKLSISANDIAIIEKHHSGKKDFPSGTSLMLADAIKSANKFTYNQTDINASVHAKNHVSIHSIRAGEEFGEHQITFYLNDEKIEIKHTATSREVFATGAINMTKWLMQMPQGLYTFSDFLKASEYGEN